MMGLIQKAGTLKTLNQIFHYLCMLIFCNPENTNNESLWLSSIVNKRYSGCPPEHFSVMLKLALEKCLPG